MRNKLINNIIYQLIWWTSVIGAIIHQPLLGFLVMVPLLYVHFRFISRNQKEIILVIIAALAGTFMDTMLNVFRVVQYNGTFEFARWLAPIWITSMWVGFSLTVNHSLSWLAKRNWLNLLLGMIFGPLAYLAGQRYGAIQLVQSQSISLLILSILWGTIIPFLYFVSRKLKLGVSHEI